MKKFEFGWGDLVALIQPIVGIIAWVTPMPLEVKMNIIILLFILTGLVCFYFYRNILGQIKDIFNRLDGNATNESVTNLANDLEDHRKKEKQIYTGLQQTHQVFADQTNNQLSELMKFKNEYTTSK